MAKLTQRRGGGRRTQRRGRGQRGGVTGTPQITFATFGGKKRKSMRGGFSRIDN